MPREPWKWERGMFVAYYPDEPGHHVMDTGFQLLTRCGKRVTHLGSVIDTGIWVPVARPGCFECYPSPYIEWATGEWE